MTDKLKLLMAFGLLVAGLVIGWSINGWRLNAKIETMRAQSKQAEIDATAAARAKETEWNTHLQEARNAATIRERTMRADAARARHSADRLRDELATIRRDLPGLAADAVRVRADTLATILGHCTTEYRNVAESADRLANDRQLLIEAWPR